MQTLFVGNIAFDATEEQIEKLFGSFGDVLSVSLPTWDEGKLKGFGFVQMMNDDEAEEARTNLDGFKLLGRPLRVEVSSGDDEPQQPDQ